MMQYSEQLLGRLRAAAAAGRKRERPHDQGREVFSSTIVSGYSQNIMTK